MGSSGSLLVERDGVERRTVTIPDPEDSYDKQYRRGTEYDYLEVVYYSGMKRIWNAGDGQLLSEEAGEPREAVTGETFETADFRIEAVYHEPTRIYRRDSGALLGALSLKGDVRYATQSGDRLFIQTKETDGTRYAYYLNGNAEILADMPDLTDILTDADGAVTLVFDDDRGNLRGSALYSLSELISLGRAFQTERG